MAGEKPTPKLLNYNLCYDDKHMMAVFKPAGVLSVPAKNQPASLEEILQDQAAPNLRAVHRLDRVTEGLLLFSKTNFGHEALLNAFKRRLLDKRYLLITEGALPSKRPWKNRCTKYKWCKTARNFLGNKSSPTAKMRRRIFESGPAMKKRPWWKRDLLLDACIRFARTWHTWATRLLETRFTAPSMPTHEATLPCVPTPSIAHRRRVLAPAS